MRFLIMIYRPIAINAVSKSVLTPDNIIIKTTKARYPGSHGQLKDSNFDKIKGRVIARKRLSLK